MSRPAENSTGRLMKAAEAAEYLGVCVKTLNRYRASEGLRFVDFGGRYRYRAADLDDFAAKRAKVIECQSSDVKVAVYGNTTSRSAVVDFTDLRDRLRSGKPKGSKRGSASKR